MCEWLLACFLRCAHHFVGQDGVDARIAQTRHHPAQTFHLVLAHLPLQARRLCFHRRMDRVRGRIVARRPVSDQCKTGPA